MDRRGFLEAAAAGLAAGTAGCGAVLEGLAPNARVTDLGAVLARLEAGLEVASGSHVMASLAPDAAMSNAPAVRAKLAALEELSRSATRCLLVAGTVKSLSPEQREDPRAVALIERASPEMDAIVAKLTGTLTELPDRQLAAFQEELRRRPDLPMSIAGKLDRRAGDYDVPGAARAKLRAAAVDVSFRLRRQPPGALIGECLAKVERVAAVRAPEATVQRQVAARVMSEAIWRSRPGSTTGTVGVYLIGVGLGVFGLGAMFGPATGNISLVVGATVGVLLVLVGLIVGLVGLIMMASS